MYKRRFFQSRISKSLVVAFLDVISMVLINYSALWIRYDFQIDIVPKLYMRRASSFVPIFILTVLALYVLFRLYSSIWRFAGANEVMRATMAYITLSPILLIYQRVGSSMVSRSGHMTVYLPRSYFLLVFILNYFCCVMIRLSYRVFLNLLRKLRSRGRTDISRIMVIGGGEAGRTIIRELALSTEMNGRAVCVIDDNINKHGLVIDGTALTLQPVCVQTCRISFREWASADGIA